MQVYKILYLESIGEFDTYHEEFAAGTFEEVKEYANQQLHTFYDEDTVIRLDDMVSDDTNQRHAKVDSITPIDSIKITNAQSIAQTPICCTLNIQRSIANVVQPPPTAKETELLYKVLNLLRRYVESDEEIEMIEFAELKEELNAQIYGN